MNGGWHVKNTVSATARLDEGAEMAALVEETEIAVDDGDYAWMALNAPPVAPPMDVVVESAAAGGF